MITDQWIRKLGLVIFSDTKGLDLSEFHIKFEACNADVQSPNNCAIRIYNMSKATIKRIIENSEFKSVVINAGYEKGNYGVIFQGYIKQFRIGKESNVDSYLDILASDGDIAYNQAFVNETMAKGSTRADVINAAAKAMNLPVDYGIFKTDVQHIPSIRGKVLFGMARDKIKNESNNLNSGWSIQNGRIQIIPQNSYLKGEIVKLNSASGLIGIPEQTDEGIRFRCLLNSKLRIGGLVQIDNSIINQTMQSVNSNSSINGPVQLPAQIQYNSYRLQPLAPLSDDGVYRLFVVEHEGDTRGQPWYSNLIGLAMDMTTQTVLAK